MNKNLMCLLALAGSLEAAPVVVNNFSFETFNPLTNICAGTGCAFNIQAIPGWTNTGDSGSFLPGNPGNTDYFDFIPDGEVVGYTNGAIISQNVGVVAANTIYTLLVEVGNRKDYDPAGVVALLVGATAYTATPVAISEGGWSTFSVVYNSLAGDAGENLAIRLSATGFQGDFDNVRLDASATTPGGPVGEAPEPGSAALAALGLASVWYVRRRRN